MQGILEREPKTSPGPQHGGRRRSQYRAADGKAAFRLASVVRCGIDERVPCPDAHRTGKEGKLCRTMGAKSSRLRSL